MPSIPSTDDGSYSSNQCCSTLSELHPQTRILPHYEVHSLQPQTLRSSNLNQRLQDLELQDLPSEINRINGQIAAAENVVQALQRGLEQVVALESPGLRGLSDLVGVLTEKVRSLEESGRLWLLGAPSGSHVSFVPRTRRAASARSASAAAKARVVT